jgi:hypothetical protein
MTREYAGLLALDAAYLGVGTIVLARLRFALGLRYAGLALIAGWTAFGIVASVVLMLGDSLDGWRLPLVVVTAAALAAVLPRPRLAAPAPPPASIDLGRPRVVGAILAAGAGVYGAVLLAQALVPASDTNWDSWAFWLPKAQAIFYFGGLDSGAGGFTTFSNPEYPPFAPVTEAAAFHAMGSVEILALPLQHWILAVAFVGAAAALLSPRVPHALLWPFLGMLVLAPGLSRYVLSSLADPQVAYMVALGGVTAALWLLERRGAYLTLCGLFLVAATLTKTEGFLLAALVPLALAAASPGDLRRHWRAAGALLALPVLALASWKAWLAAHDQPLNSELYDFRDAFRPGFLADRVDRLSFALEELLGILLAPDRWLLVVPAAIVAAALAARTQRRLSVFALGWLVVAFLGLASVYWISTVDVAWYVDTSAERVVLSLAAFAAVLTPLLLTEALRAAATTGGSTGRARVDGERQVSDEHVGDGVQRVQGERVGEGGGTVDAVGGEREDGRSLERAEPRR